jgi:diguanylate cyclase (GGDEF)-like protein
MTSDVDRTAFRLSVLRRQGPRALFAAFVILAAFSLINWASGVSTPLDRILNLPVAALLLASAWATSRPWLPERLLPWLVATVSMVAVLVFEAQAAYAGTGSGYAYVLVALTLYPSLVMAWVPVLLTLVPLLAGAVWAVQYLDPALTFDWLAVTAAAVATGLLLLVLRLRAIDELGDASSRLRQVATHDGLTGVLNRHGVEEQVPLILAMAERHHEGLFVVFADVDGLKAANDVHGHDFGDEVLRSVASALVARVRIGDLVGRWGGDEFIIVGLGRPDHPDDLATRVREHVEDGGLDLTRWDGRISVGSACWTAEESAAHRADGIAELLSAADADMYARRRERRAA